ncbi:unnamed protein product [Absidia cylindrospora]
MLPANRPVLRKVISLNVYRPYSVLAGSANNNSKPNLNNESIISNAPNWDENHATESEADVKADRDPDDISSIEKKSTNWFQQKSKNK